MGCRLLLKPHIDIEDGTWRALLKPSNVDDFFASYKTFILHYAGDCTGNARGYVQCRHRADINEWKCLYKLLG